MTHRIFIQLYQSRSHAGTWRNWIIRHAADRQCPLLGDWSHERVQTAFKDFKGILPRTLEELRDFLIHYYSAGLPHTVNHRNGITLQGQRALMKASGLEWFERDERPFIHWKHQPKETHEQIQKAV